MARIYIEPAGVRRALASEADLTVKLNRLAHDVENVRSAMDYRIAGQAAISARLRDVSEQAAKEAKGVANVRNCLEQALSRYERTENANLGRTQASSSDGEPSGTGDGGRTLAEWLRLIGTVLPPGSLFPGIGPAVSLLSFLLPLLSNPVDVTRRRGILMDDDENGKIKTGGEKKLFDSDADDFASSKSYVDLKTGKVTEVDPNDEKAVKEFEEHNQDAIEVDAKFFSVGAGTSFSLYGDKTEVTGKYGGTEASIDFGKMEAEAGAYIGSLGLGAAAGASITAFSAEEKAYLGTESLNVYEELGVSAGRLEAKAAVNAGLTDKDGKFNPSLYAGASAEAIAGELRGKVGVNALGADVGIEGSVNYGVGAHANVGMHDGKISVDIGVSLGVGGSVKLDVDVSGTIEAVHNKAQEVWSGVRNFLSW